MSTYSPIKELIPHRFPFLYVDRLTDVTKEYTVGERFFGEDEPFFQGHFPTYPVVPGVILVESMAQCGGAGIRELGLLPPGVIFVLASIEKVKFRNQVRPGDTITIRVKNLRTSKMMLRQSGEVYVGDTLCVEATWMCVINNDEQV
ncbi:MAG: 3-hydroxyacyl-ACP dehydratase FabZ [Sphaerochaetaceae bacterium]|jgi:3-hydroxyacyl-[acyl-carrier-protein] dehydratase